MKQIIVVLLLYLLVLSTITLAQAVTPAGTLITNHVNVSYIDPNTGKRLTAVSNEITITLRAVAVALLESDLQQVVAPGETVHLTHTLSNTGNVADSFALTLKNLTDDGGDLVSLKLYNDSNANGVLDDNEAEITTTNELPVGAVVYLVIKGIVAENATEGMQIKLSLTAVSQNAIQEGTKRVTNIDTLTVSGAGSAAEQQTQIRFLTPTSAALQDDGQPDFYNNADFVDAQQYRLDTESQGGQDSGYDPVRDGIYVEIQADDIETLVTKTANKLEPIKLVSLESLKTGDSLKIAIREIAANTGIYRSIRPIRLSSVQSGNGGSCPSNADAYQESQPDYAQVATECVLRSVPDDRLRVTVSKASATAVIDTAVVAALGMVFDSISGQALSGMQVKFLTAKNTPALDPISGKEIEVQPTDADGQFRFPTLAAGQYCLLVSGREQRYHFPSTLVPDTFTKRAVNDYSYGENGFKGIHHAGLFTITAEKPTLTIDIPVDPELLRRSQQLVLDKKVLSTEAMLGDLVTYTLSISNLTGEDIRDVHVYDALPKGLTLVSSTISLDSVLRDDMATVSGNQVDFLLGDLANEGVLELVYALRVTAKAHEGEAINRAYLRAKTLADETLQSTEKHAKIRIKNRGVLSSEGILFGKVHFDQQCDYATERDNGVLPLGGIRLYLEDGRYAVTDGAGDYSFYGMEKGLHTIKLDSITLPSQVFLKVTHPQQANDPRSYFVDISAGDYHRADFVAQCLNSKLDKTKTKKILATIAKNNKRLHDTDLLNEAGSRTQSNKREQTEQDDNKSVDKVIAKATASEEGMPLSKKVVKTVTYQQGKKGTWLWPKKGISTDGRFMAVIRSGVKKPLLYVNGEAVSIEQMGEQLGNKKARAQVLAWYGVALEEGENTLLIKGIGPRGKMRTLAKGVFTKPSRGVEIKITPLKEALVADGGRSSLPLKIAIFDKQGNPAIGDYFLTLHASEGEWQGNDIQAGTEGHQIKLSKGEAIVYLRSGSKTGKVHISVKADTLLGETDVSQIAHLRPLFVTGYVNIQADSAGRRYGRTKFFMKGKVWGDKHLTLSFDSDKPYQGNNQAYREALYNSYYPLLGDASLRGYEALSRSKLFAKLEKGKRSIMWGEYQTDKLSSIDLARVQRILNGLNINIDTGKTQFQLFAAAEEGTHFTEEFRGNGTASNYPLERKNIVPNSEVIELVIRDQQNTGLVISTETLQRLVDYTLDPITGYLTFHRVIPSLDDALNPVFIRIAYDVETDGENYLVGGVRLQRSLSDEVKIGASYTHDANTENGSDLTGTYLSYKPNAKTEITASAAQMSQTNTDEKGESYRLTAKHVWSNNASSDITIGRTDREFTQSNGGVSADRQEIKLQHSHKLDKKTRFTIEGTHSESLSEEQKNQTLGATLQTRKGKWLLEGGLRHIEQQSAVSTTKTETFRVGLKRGIKLLEHNGRIGLGYEQDMNDSSRHYLTADAEMAVNKNASIYGRYETGSDLTGALGLANSTLSKRFILGAKSKISPQMNLYSEYRSRDLTGAFAAETASGLRGSITVEKGLTLTPSLEIVKTIDGDTLQDSVAASLAVTDVRDHDKRKTLRVETRQGESSNSYTIEGSYIERLDDVWTAVFREELRATTSDTEGDYGSHVFTLGLAQRQRDNGKHNSLYLYQWKENKGINTTSDRSVHLLSTQQHYQANDELEFTIRLGGKIQTTHLAGQNHRMDVVLLDGKTSYAIDDRVDLFVRAGVLGSEHFDEQRYSAGLGMNVTVKDNIRIGLGYNDSGFDDEDLDIDKQNADGFFVNLTLKADERWFEWQDKKNKKGVK